MNQTQIAGSRRLLLYRIVSVAAVAATVLLRTLNLLFFYDKSIGYYESGSVIPVLTEAFVVLAILFFAVFAITTRKDDAPLPALHTPWAHGAALVSAAALAVFAVAAYSESSGAIPSPYAMPLFVTAACGMLYWLLFALRKGTAAIAAVTGIGLIVFFAVLLLESYMDMTVQMNAPTKLAEHIGCMGGMLLVMAELRPLCGFAKRRFYLFCLSTAALLLGTASIPSLLADALGRLPARRHPLSDLVFFALTLFCLVRLLLPGKEEIPEEAEAEDETEDADETRTAPTDESDNEQNDEQSEDVT